MARMKLLPLICLVLAASAGSARAQEATAERFDAGRFSFIVPSSSTVERHADLASVRVEVRYGLYFDVRTYSWWAHYVAGTPATAREYVETDWQERPQDFKMIEPAKLIEFNGYPAWTVTYSYTIRKRLGKGEIHVTESYLAVQRPLGYTVIMYKNDSEFFADDKPKFDAFLGSIILMPGPVGIPVLPVAAILIALGVVAMLFVKKRAVRNRGALVR